MKEELKNLKRFCAEKDGDERGSTDKSVRSSPLEEIPEDNESEVDWGDSE